MYAIIKIGLMHIRTEIAYMPEANVLRPTNWRKTDLSAELLNGTRLAKRDPEPDPAKA